MTGVIYNDCDHLSGRMREACEGRIYSPEKTALFRRNLGLPVPASLFMPVTKDYQSPANVYHPNPSIEIKGGVGTELKKILSWLSIKPQGCQCNHHVMQMNYNGVQWCEDNIHTIIGWLKEEAAKRSLVESVLASGGGAYAVVKLAIFNAKRKEATGMRWAYGLTTVPLRRDNGLLQRTLTSLATAGFDKPRLFVDGAIDCEGWFKFGLEVTLRCGEPARTVGNWYAALSELWYRDPNADRYAVFQDDFVTYVGLRDYLNKCNYPDRGYLNLYTFPHNQARCTGTGWFESDQLGKGAVALVFSSEAVRTLLQSQHIIDKAMDPIRGHRSLDGGVVDSFRKAGWKEYIHNPSLVQHTGLQSSMGNSQHAQAISFRGEAWDVRQLIAESSHAT